LFLGCALPVVHDGHHDKPEEFPVAVSVVVNFIKDRGAGIRISSIS
jgi:hypothetical protein